MEEKKRQTNTFKYCESVLRQNFTFGKLDADGAIQLPCLLFIGTLNEPHYKCHNCGKEEWQHKL